MNYEGDKGSPCLRPLKLEKKLDASPLIKIEKHTIEIQKEIHFLHLLGKPIF